MGIKNSSQKENARTLARIVAWVTLLIFMLGVGIYFWLKYKLGLTSSYQDVAIFLGFGAFALVGSVLVAKIPTHPISWIMVTIGLTVGLGVAADTYAAYIMATHGSPNILAVLGAWFNDIYWYPLLMLALVYIPLLFPDGHLPSPRWFPLALLPGITTMVIVALSAFRETLIGQSMPYRIDNPIGIAGLPIDENHPLNIIMEFLIGISLLGAAAAVLVRFRRSAGVERQQLKWFLTAVALLPVMQIFDALTNLGDLGFIFSIVAIPTSIGIAILRYRLYDIDLIIRRTLQYTLLTGLLALVYFGSVVLLQSTFETLTGQGSPVVIVISTLGIAALFTPLRRRVQDFIDRRFYRRKYDAEQTLSEFAAIARDEVDLEKLTDSLIGAVAETMQPEQVSLWLKEVGEVRKGAVT